MKSLRVGIALLLCAATTTPGWAEEQADRTVTTFAKVVVTTFEKLCLAKPDSMTVINAIATAQGFALDKPDAAALAKAETENPFSLLVFWKFGAGESRMRLTGLIAGNGDRYELACILDGYGVPPEEVLAVLKPVLGEPATRTVKENNWIDVAWTAKGDVTLHYKEGEGQRVSLTLVQILGKWAKPK